LPGPVAAADAAGDPRRVQPRCARAGPGPALRGTLPLPHPLAEPGRHPGERRRAPQPSLPRPGDDPPPAGLAGLLRAVAVALAASHPYRSSGLDGAGARPEPGL